MRRRQRYPPVHRPCAARSLTLTIAATLRARTSGRWRTADHYNGKVDSPRLARRALSRLEMAALVRPPFPTAPAADLIAAWDFAKGVPGEQVIDVSGNGHHGRTVNLPVRGMTGFNWTGEKIRWSDRQSCHLRLQPSPQTAR